MTASVAALLVSKSAAVVRSGGRAESGGGENLRLENGNVEGVEIGDEFKGILMEGIERVVEVVKVAIAGS